MHLFSVTKQPFVNSSWGYIFVVCNVTISCPGSARMSHICTVVSVVNQSYIYMSSLAILFQDVEWLLQLYVASYYAAITELCNTAM